MQADYIADQIIQQSIKPELSKLDAYIEQLSQSKRFQGVQGKLYDVVRGWNPGYRVFAKDLLSPIPQEPFEEIHHTNGQLKADVSFSEPAYEETD